LFASIRKKDGPEGVVVLWFEGVKETSAEKMRKNVELVCVFGE